MSDTIQHHSVSALLRRIGSTVREYAGERFVQLLVFGSVARGDAREDSDIDILLVVRRKIPADAEFIADLCADVLLEHSIVLSLFCVGEQEFSARLFNPLFRNVRREGIALDC
jgi:uncharacterized protein